MASSTVFEWTCTALEGGTTLDRLEARGTLRLALKSAGLDAQNVTSDQMKTVLIRLLPTELEARGITDAAMVCEQMASQLESQNIHNESAPDSPEDVFARLGGG